MYAGLLLFTLLVLPSIHARSSQFKKKIDFKKLEKDYIEEDLDLYDKSDRELADRLNNKPPPNRNLGQEFFIATLGMDITMEAAEELAKRWPSLLKSGGAQSSTASAIKNEEKGHRIMIMSMLGEYKDIMKIKRFLLDQPEVVSVEHDQKDYTKADMEQVPATGGKSKSQINAETARLVEQLQSGEMKIGEDGKFVKADGSPAPAGKKNKKKRRRRRKGGL